MSLRESLRDDLADLDALELVASALADQSVRAIAKVRALFERSVPFYQNVHDLYALIRFRAAREGVVVGRPSGGSGVAAVALTSNHRFYGELNLAVVRALLERGEDGTRTIVIGRVGTLYMKELGYMRRMHSFLFAEDTPSVDELAALLSRLEAYERVILYYPAFINLLEQRTETIEIGAVPTQNLRGRKAGTRALELTQGRQEAAVLSAMESAYIFEPELVELVRFFETEVRRFLFQRVFLEAELARTAARLIAMSTAERTIGARKRSVRGALRRVSGAVETMRTLETFASIIEWRRIQEKNEAPVRTGRVR